MAGRIVSPAATTAPGFFEIDTGKDARAWTVQLTDPGQARQ